MKLYMVRHGIALDIGEQGVTRDFDRPLSESGQRKTAAAGRGLRAMGCRPDVIGSSPLVRAWQTAECLRAVYDEPPELEVCDFMAPGGSPVDLVTWCNTHPPQSTLMLVGHMPDVAWHTHELLVEEDRQPLPFKKAAVACIAFPDRARIEGGRLEWFKQPRTLREAGMNT